jgi:glycosyltransferase involved in cell wall biosynthesis
MPQRPELSSKSRELLRRLRYYLGPMTLAAYRKSFATLLEDIRPDIVHAMRIPFEGMLASVTPQRIPMVISIWGNDITLHAKGSFLMSHLTRQALKRADGLLADTQRDIQLGINWGFSSERPTLTIPGAGGVHLNEIEETISEETVDSLPEELPEARIVVNPRGQRPGSLRQDNFFRAIPLVLKKNPNTFFICPSLASDHQAIAWVDQLRIKSNTVLWPRLNQAQLWRLLKKADIYVSPSIHDGTPNSLLEAMACGCFPVVGDIESMREWVRPDENGILIDANSPQSIANGIIKALESPNLLVKARTKNASLIAERAEYTRCMEVAEAFYCKILESKNPKFF